MRDRIISGIISALFVLLIVSLFYTQVVRFFYYSRMSKNNSIRIIPIDGPRGRMLDRNGQVMVSSRISFDAVLVYQELRDAGRL